MHSGKDTPNLCSMRVAMLTHTSALASLGDGEGADDGTSPPSNASSPPVVKTAPAGAADARLRSKSPLGDKEGGEKQ